MRSRAGRPLRRVPTAGFTIVELMVAVMVLSIGVLGLASTAAVVLRLIGGGAQQTRVSEIAQSRFESLRARRCAQVTGGYASSRGVREVWTVSVIDQTTFDVVDTLRYNTRDGVKVQAYRSAVRCQP